MLPFSPLEKHLTAIPEAAYFRVGGSPVTFASELNLAIDIGCHTLGIHRFAAPQ